MWPNDGNPTNYYLSQLERLQLQTVQRPTPKKKKPISVGPADKDWVIADEYRYYQSANTGNTPTMEEKFAQQGISLAEAQSFITGEVARMASHMESSFREAYRVQMESVIKDLKLEMAVLQEQLDELSEAVNE